MRIAFIAVLANAFTPRGRPLRHAVRIGAFDCKGVAVDVVAALIVKAIDALQRQKDPQAADLAIGQWFVEVFGACLLYTSRCV